MAADPAQKEDESPLTRDWARAELFIVWNHRSGAHQADASAEQIQAALARSGRPHRLVPVAPGDMARSCHEAGRLASAQGGVLVAAGGDGTVNAVAQAALAHDCPLGVLPQGTFNLFARDLGLPLDAAGALTCLLQARPEPVQVGWVNQRLFLVNASVGMYPKLLADREVAKQRLGRHRWIAVLAGLVSLFEWRLQLALDVELDGRQRRLRTPSLFVSNNRVQLTRVGIDDAVVRQVGAGRLAGIAARDIGWGTKLRLFGRALAGNLGESREIESFTLRSLNVGARSTRRLRVATDGEVGWMELPLRFTVAPRPLQVMLPPPEMRVARQ